MKEEINFKRELACDFDAAIERVTASLQGVGFGILTRIDMHTKVKEKIGKEHAATRNPWGLQSNARLRSI